MAFALKRTIVLFVALMVTLAAAYLGYQLAQGTMSAPSFGDVQQIDSVGHKEGHKVPPACYGTAPGHDKVREKNKNCTNQP